MKQTNKLLTLKLSLTLLSLFCCLQMFAAEEYQEFKSTKIYVTPSSNYMEFQINYANDRYNDSYTNSPMTISINGTSWETKAFTGEIGGISRDDNWKVNEEKNGMLLQMGKCYSSGNNFWLKGKITFKNNVYDGQHMTFNYSCQYRVDRGSNKYQSQSCVVFLDIPRDMTIINNNISITSNSSRKYSVNAKNPYNNSDCGTYDIYAITSSKEVSEMISSTADISVGHSAESGYGRAQFSFNAIANSDYTPTQLHFRYTYQHRNEAKFYAKTNNILFTPHFVRPKNLKVSVSDQWLHKVTLNWDVERYDDNSQYDGWWLITRTEKGGNEEFVYANEKKVFGNLQYTTPSSEINGQEYTYKVTFVPKAWGEPTSSNFKQKMSPDLYQTIDVLFKHDYKFKSLTISDIKDGGTGFYVDWNSTTIGDDKTYDFVIYRYSESEDRQKAQDVGIVKVSKADGSSHRYKDASITDLTQSYTYFVKVKIDSEEFTSEEKTKFSDSHNGIESFIATTGEYNNHVNLSWTARRVDEAITYYELYRKKEGTDDNHYSMIANPSGSDMTFAYTDNGINIGDIYVYKLKSYVLKKTTGKKYGEESLTTIGFASQTAVISGSVTFDTGTAVDSVRIGMEKQDNLSSRYHSLRIDGEKSGIKWKPKNLTSSADFTGAWSIQLFVSPDNMDYDATIFQTSSTKVVLSGLSNGYYSVKVGSSTVPNVKVPAGKFSTLNLSYDKKDLIVTDVEEINNAPTITTGSVSSMNLITNENDSVCFGAVSETDATKAFHGYLDEIRIFANRSLNTKEILSTYDRYLSGNETGLVAYWKLDEGIENQSMAYDCSQSEGTPNSNHASIVGVNYRIENKIVPNELGYYTLTDSLGNYVMRGIPYIATGTNYLIRPAKGTHDFSPKTCTRFINSNSNTFNAINFTDVSSFPVKGVIYYEGTTCPVEDCILYVDGSPANKDGNVIMTDDNGEYEISVPIGEHFIQVKKDGHTFANEGRYPETGRFDFRKEVNNLTFNDNTKVVVTGRVCGGSKENEKPLGLAQSINNIGKAQIVLSTEYMPGSNGMLNAKAVVNGNTVTYEPAGKTRTFEGDSISKSPTGGVVLGDTRDNTKFVTIETDNITGEFAVKLPPLKYVVKSVKIINNKDNIAYEKIADVDATNVRISLTDSLQEGGGMKYYTYNVKVSIPEYHSTADFLFTQNGKADGVFGEDTLKLEKATLNFYSVKSGKVTYTYGYPFYTMSNNYKYKVKVQEKYTNYDNATSPKTSIYPLAGTSVVFNNAMSAEDYGADTLTHKLVKLQNQTITLDSLGQGTYAFKAGFPNIEESMGFKSQLEIMYHTGESYKTWTNPYTADGKFYGIVLGSIPLGTNFITAGPDRVDMVLRDPPGTNSFATWKKGTSITNTWKKTNGSTFTNDGYVGLSLGTKISTGVGFGCIVINEIEGKASAGWVSKVDNNSSTSTSTTITHTSTQDVSTSSSPEFDGPDADIFIGTSTNTTIGDVRNVGFHWNGSEYKLGVRKMTAFGEEFKTTFNYTRNYIETTAIPQFRTLIEQLEEARKSNPSAGYYTKKDDLGHIIKYDSLDYYNTQIENWEKQLARDEYQKVTAINNQSKYLINNFSFDGGTQITNTMRTDSATMAESETYTNIANGFKITGGITFDGVGPKDSTQPVWGKSTTSTTENDTLKWAEFEYTLKESGTYDVISVDVYNSPEGMAPIFRTRGGITSGYYEDEHKTKYLTKYYPKLYSNEQVIMAKTKKVYVPKILDCQKEYINIPAGSMANVKMTLANQSEIEGYGYFTFTDVPGTNKDNAIITVNGSAIGGGQMFRLDYGKPQEITVGIRQQNLDVKDYSIVFSLVDNTQATDEGTYLPNLDTVRINVHFVAASCPINIATSSPYYNKKDSNVVFTFSGYDLQMTNLKEIGLEYQIPGNQAWYTAKKWTVNASDDPEKDIHLPEYQYKMAMVSTFVDGTYNFRAFTRSVFSGKDAYAYSEEVAFTKDTSAPQSIGSVMPYNGVYGFDGEVSVTFNEDIVQGNISNNDVSLRGILDDDKDEVSVYFNGDKGIETQARVQEVSGNSTTSMWVKRSNRYATGTLWKRQAGNDTRVVVDTLGRVMLISAGDSLISSKTLPLNKWVFLNLTLNVSDNKYNLSMTCLEDGSKKTTPDTLMNAVVRQSTLSLGKMVIGENFVGSIKRLSFWDASFDFFQALANDRKTKTQFTPNLIAYWPMNEGSGTVLNEVVNGNNIVLNSKNDWIIDRNNYSLGLSKSHLTKMDLSKIVTEKDEDYSTQFWFRANKEQGNFGQLIGFSADGKTYGTRIGLDHSSGKLQLRDGNNVVGDISSDNYLDDKWHRFAMTVSKSNNGNATFYIDGTARYSTSAASISNLIGLMYMGGDFYGNIDEFRIWKRNLSADEIDGNMHKELNTDIDDVALYLPFNKDSIDQYMQRHTVFSLEDLRKEKDGTPYNGALTLVLGTKLNGSNELVPPVMSADVLSDVAFELVKSERKIQFKIKDSEETKIQGRTLYASVKNVRDFAGNVADEFKWDFSVSLDKVHWGEYYLLDGGEDIRNKTYNISIVNNTNVEQSWYITNIPKWMVVNQETGKTAAYGTTQIELTLLDGMPSGLNTGNLYLCETNTSFSSSLPYALCLTYNSPNWTVDSHKYQNQMSIVGQIVINDIKKYNIYSKLAAFNEKDECVGVASPTYYDRTDGYYISMTVYGDNKGTTPLKFRYYDATEGVIYANLKGKTDITFEPNAFVGSYANPYIWTDDKNVEQFINLAQGFDMFSVNVFPTVSAIESVFNFGAKGADYDKARVVSNDDFSVFDGTTWSGEITTIQPGKAYQWDGPTTYTVDVTGTLASEAGQKISLRKGWNWIGANVNKNILLMTALSDVLPTDGDKIRDEYEFASYENGGWIGDLLYITPGEGYKYYNNDEPKEFSYPTNAALSNAKGSLQAKDFSQEASYLSKYSGVMTIVAAVENNGVRVGNVELTAYDTNGEIRGYKKSHDEDSRHLIYMVIHGDKSETISLASNSLSKSLQPKDKVFSQSESGERGSTILFEEGRGLGTPSNPYIIEIGGTGIQTMPEVNSEELRVKSYDLSGRKINNLDNYKHNKGVFIINGKKVVIK